MKGKLKEMNSTIKKTIAAMLFAFAMIFSSVAVIPNTAMATDCNNTSGGIVSGVDCAKTDSTKNSDLPTIFKNIINAALYLIGAVSVLMLIYGGIRYTLSAGNATNVTAAKNTILYAIVGIVVALLAYAIVNWVLGAIGVATNS